MHPVSKGWEEGEWEILYTCLSTYLPAYLPACPLLCYALSHHATMSSEVEPATPRPHHEAFPQLYRRGLRDSSSSSTQQKPVVTVAAALPDDDRVEYPPMPEEKKLGAFSTAALIISKMIGTGVFAKPAIVLLNSGGKTIALSMWLAGGAMTLCG